MGSTRAAPARREIRSKRVCLSRVAIPRLSRPVVVRGRAANRRAPAFAKSIRARLAQTGARRINPFRDDPAIKFIIRTREAPTVSIWRRRPVVEKGTRIVGHLAKRSPCLEDQSQGAGFV